MTAPTLDYAPPRPWHRQRRWRWSAVGVAAVAVGLANWRYGPPVYRRALLLYRRALLLYRQRQCLGLTLPADQVVYDEDPATRGHWTGHDGYTLTTVAESFRTNLASTTAAFTRTTTAACYLPRCYAEFDPAAAASAAVVFAHERVSKAGVRRLVVVHLSPTSWWETVPFSPYPSLKVETYTPATWRAGPVRPDHWGFGGPTSFDGTGPPAVRVYAGQADPADPSHFTVRYRAYGRDHVADGWLTAAGDDVDWRVRP